MTPGEGEQDSAVTRVPDTCERSDRPAPSQTVLRELAVYLTQGLEERARWFGCRIDDAAAVDGSGSCPSP